MYKQFETLAEIYDTIAQLLRACDYAKIPATAVQETASGDNSTILKIYLDVNGQDYYIEYWNGIINPIYQLDKNRVTKKELLNELNKLTQVVEELEELTA